MPRGIFNWNFTNVRNFLKARGFVFNHAEGSHHYFVGSHDGKFRQVTVPFHGSKAIKPRTLKGIIAQSGIPQSEWLR